MQLFVWYKPYFVQQIAQTGRRQGIYAHEDPIVRQAQADQLIVQAAPTEKSFAKGSIGFGTRSVRREIQGC
jgi:hypothetical protein